jgi:hypothetical protein
VKGFLDVSVPPFGGVVEERCVPHAIFPMPLAWVPRQSLNESKFKDPK